MRGARSFDLTETPADTAGRAATRWRPQLGSRRTDAVAESGNATISISCPYSMPLTPPESTSQRSTPVVFIGSGEASLLERKVLIHSIRRSTPGPVEIVVFNGTHNTLEREGRAPELAPMSLRAKYQNITEFSNYRFLIPQLCGHRGRALYLDSDMVCIGDLHELFDAPMGDAAFLAKPFTDFQGQARWGLSVTLFDCVRCQFDLDTYASEIDHGLYGYNDLQQMSPAFLAAHPFRIGSIDPHWNAYDELTERTRLIHYTNLHMQPWKVRGHPHGDFWFRRLSEAREAGAVTDDDIELSIRRGYVRADLVEGNTIGVGSVVRNALSDLKAAVRDGLRARS